ncbi:MAG: FHA domain-containing protein [Planctomycetes bacterium]|nr:FHA domain-containing protein [Planctomycetota bacterium]
MSHDYYQVLGVERTEPEITITRAYRTLLKRYRPEQGEGDARALRQIEQAYGVLTQPHLRTSYDRALMDITEARPVTSDDIYQMLSLTFDQAALGGRVSVERLAPTGPDRVEVRVPRGIEEGTLLRIPGMGLRKAPGEHAGDLILLVNVKAHPRLKRDGLDLYMDVTVPTDVAKRGGRVRAGTLEGELELNVPRGTQGGEKLLVRRAGLVDEEGRRGDLYAIVRLSMPELEETPPAEPTIDTQRTAAADAVELTQSLRLRLDQLDRESVEIEHRRKVTINWEKQIAVKQATLDAMATRLTARASRLKAYRQAIADRAASPATEADASHMIAEHQRVEIELRELTRQRESLANEQAGLETVRRSLDDAREKLEADVAKLVSGRQKLEADMAALLLERVELTTAQDHWRRQKADEAAAIADERQTIAGEREAVSTERAALKERLDAHQIAMAHEHQAIAEQRTALQTRTQELDEREAELTGRLTHLEQRQATLARHQAELDAEAERLAKLEGAAPVDDETLIEQRLRIERLTRELEEALETVAAERTEKEELCRRIAAERTAIAAQQDKVRSTTAKLEQRRRRLVKMRGLLKQRAAMQAKIVATEAPASIVLPTPVAPAACLSATQTTLVVYGPQGSQRPVPLSDACTLIGRESHCRLRVPVSTVSREHCHIIERVDGLWLRDLGSKNGTFHNGRPVSEAKLHDGDSISVGPVHFSVTVAE